MEKQPNLTLCMIVKNEEKYLQGCLESVDGVVDEIVITDTGSTDKTIEIAGRFNAKIFNFEWINDFSAARNFSLSKCTGRWILYLDADERLSSESKQTLPDIIRTDEKIGVYCNVVSAEKKRGSTNIMSYARLFSNSPNIRFSGAVHEQIESSLRLENYKFVKTDIEIIHLGYDIEQEGKVDKAKRNLDILVKDYAKNPTGYLAFHIGSTYVVLNQLNESIPYFNKALEDPKLDYSHKAHCYRYMAAYEINVTRNFDLALAYAESGLKLSEKQPLLNVIVSNAYLYKGDVNRSEKYCRLAYKYNEEQKSNIHSSFEIVIEESMILQHIVNIAALTANKTLFNDFYPKIKDFEIQEKYHKLFLTFNLIFNNNILNEGLINDSGQFIETEYLESLVFLLNNYTDNKSRDLLLSKLAEKFPNHLGLLFLLGQTKMVLDQNEEAITCFEQFHLIDKNNPTVVNNLISLYFKTNNIKKLFSIIDDAIILFEGDKDIHIKLKALKEKLLTLYK